MAVPFISRVLIAAAAGIILSACSRDSSPVAPAAQTLTITGIQTVREGLSVTLTAVLRSPGGRIETTTAAVTWSSETPAIASVTESGLVRALAPGQARIRATYQTVSATADVTVTPLPRFLYGRVLEAPPNEGIPIPRSTVIGTDSIGETQTTLADGSGYFTLRLAPGPVQLTVSAPNHATAVLAVDLALAGIANLPVPLAPTIREARIGFDPAASSEPFVVEQHFTVTVPRPGVLRAFYTSTYASASAQGHTCLELRDANNRVLDTTRGSYDSPASEIRRDVAGGEVFEVKFFSCNPGGGPPIVSLAGWGGEIRYPN